MGFFAKLGGSLLKVLLMAVFLFGAINETRGDFLFRHQLDSAEFSAEISTERHWLYAINIIYIVNFCCAALVVICFGCCGICHSWSKDADEAETRALKKVELLASYLQLSISFIAFYKLIVFGSMLNKLRYYGYWQGTDDWSWDITFLPFFNRHASNESLEKNLKELVKLTSFNLFRTVVFYIAGALLDDCKWWKKILQFVALLVPAFFITLLGAVKATASLMTFHYTQRYHVEKGQLGTNYDINMAIASCFFGWTVAFVIGTVGMRLLSKLKSCCNGGDRSYSTIGDTDDEEEEAWDFLIAYFVKSLVTGMIFYAPFCLAAAIIIHNHTGLWDVYIKLEVAFNAVACAAALVTCCYDLCCNLRAAHKAQEDVSMQ